MILNKDKNRSIKQRRGFADSFHAQKNADKADEKAKALENNKNIDRLDKNSKIVDIKSKITRSRRFNKQDKEEKNELNNDTNQIKESSRFSRRNDAKTADEGRRSSEEYKRKKEREKIEEYHDKRRKVFRGVFIGVIACVVITAGYLAFKSFDFDFTPKEKTTLVNTNMESVSEDAVKLTLIHNGIETKLETNVKTVGELLEENNIEVTDDIHVSSELDDSLYDTMEIVVSQKIEVNIVKNNASSRVTTHYTTVGQVLEDAGIEYEEADIVEPSADTMVEADMEIVYKDVSTEEIKVVETIPYEVEEGETNTVNAGLYAITQEGVDGTAQITYEVKYIDGVEDSRTEIAREVVVEAIPMIKLWGTAIASSSGSSDSSSDSDDSDDDTSDYDEITVSNPGEQATNPSIPAAPSSYIETMSGHVTAYTHTGSGTATGTQPRSTRTLENPGTCAVVPSTIPYGSLLYVTGYGYCIAEDTGAFRHDADRWNQIDLFMNTKDECYTWGRRDDVKVYILRRGY